LFMYCINTDTDGWDIEWEDGHISDKYIRPSNVSSLATGQETLHFNAEFNEYNREINYNSLFEKYHSKFINAIYSPYAKRIKITAMLPSLHLVNLKLNDQITYNGVGYNIDQMNINITTGEVKFDLLRITDEFDVYRRPEGRPIKGTAWESVETNWESIDEEWNNDFT